MAHDLTNIKVSRDETNWEAEIKAEIPVETLERYRKETLKEMQKTAKLDGFRPGMAPIERIIAIYGEGEILKHAAEHAIQHELPELLAAEKILAIEAPHVTIGTPEAGKPLALTARMALAPKVELPDYKKIAAKHPAAAKEEVSDAEHQEALMHLRRERARIDKMETGLEPQKAVEESKNMEEKDLPALDDVFVQSLGYENADAFSKALRENIKKEKEFQQRDKRRQGILDDLIKESRISYPATLREYELNDMEARLKEDLTRVNHTLEQYLAEMKKTREQLRAEWKDAADKRTRIRLILSEIARKEHVDADAEELSRQLGHAKKHFPEAEEDMLRANIAHAMRNEAVLKFLETL